MEHLFRGETLDHDLLADRLKDLETTLRMDLTLGPCPADMVIDAVTKLMARLDEKILTDQWVAKGMAEWQVKYLLDQVKGGLSKEALELKMKRELSHCVGKWYEVSDGIREKLTPYGVVTHIGAGNVVALSVISVIEGLLTGNINLLKLPSYEGGVSLGLLKQLLEIEPRLKPYVYVLDVPSSDAETMALLAKVSDAVIVWGSDEAVLGIRQMAPTTVKIIEWGHKISFAYMTVDGRSEEKIQEELEGLAEEICQTDQLYCSAPQVLFVEAKRPKAILRIGRLLLESLVEKDRLYPRPFTDIPIQCEITWQKSLVRLEEISGSQKLLESEDRSVSVMLDRQPSLKVSPMYRNIWVMPVVRQDVLSILRPHKGHLQTAGLSCEPGEWDVLAEVFYRSGVNRVTAMSQMSSSYSGEPHDGRPTLFEYVRRVRGSS